MSKSWHYGDLIVHDGGSLPPMVAGRRLPLNCRERIVLSLLAAGEGREIPEATLKQALGRARTPVKVIISTLKSRMADAGTTIATIERGESGYLLTPKPVIEKDAATGPMDASFSFNRETGRFSRNGTDIRLSPNGRRLFGLLCASSPGFVTHAQLLDAMRCGEDTPRSRRALASAIWNLRRRLAQVGAGDFIETSSKLGYRLRQL